MHIIIVGCGKVGYTLAETLSAEKHDVFVIDSKAEIASRVSALDVNFIQGNGASYRVLTDAGVNDCDFLIAVTSRDEINLLCCLIAKKAGVKRTVARVRDPEYHQEIDFIKDELGLELAINPELSAANYIRNLIRCPSAMELNTFARGNVQMISLDLPFGSPWEGKNLIEINSGVPHPMLIPILEKHGTAIIPDGHTTLHAGDRISVIVPTDHLNDFFARIGIRTKEVHNVMIIGGSTTAFYLAQQLLSLRMDVTIIEADRARCEHLSELLPKATILCGNASNEKLLLEEGLEKTDAFVSLTNFDEENIMLSLYANRMSHAKLITKVNKTNFSSVISEIPVGSVVSPKHLTAEIILRFARAMRNSSDSEVEAVHMLADDQVEALSFRIKDKSAVTGKPLMHLKLKRGILVGAIIRDSKLIIPSGQDMMQPDDMVIIVTTRKGLDNILGILE